MENNGNYSFGFYKTFGHNKFCFWVIDKTGWVSDAGIIRLSAIPERKAECFMKDFVRVREASVIGLGAGFALAGYDGSRQQQAADYFYSECDELIISCREISYISLKHIVPDLDEYLP